ILDWLNRLSPIKYAHYQAISIRERRRGTGKWLLNSPEFQSWVSRSKQTLFCPGILGAGKTIITSIVVEHLFAKFGNETDVGIVYLYHRSDQRQEPVHLLAALLNQLIEVKSSMPESVRSLYSHHKAKETRPSCDEIFEVLQSVIADYSRLYIIIDALDQHENSNGDHTLFLGKIFELQAKTGSNILATSRFIPKITKEFARCVSLEIRASDEDVRRYLDASIYRLKPNLVDTDLQEEIKATITEAADGMFLTAAVYFEKLLVEYSTSDIEQTLRGLRKEFKALDIHYRQSVSVIDNLRPDLQKLVKKALSWVIHARRPLTTLELQHALAVAPGMATLNEENIPDIDGLLSVCAGWVIVNETNRVHFAHYTAREYFKRTWTSWLPSAQADIAKICITYLSLNTFESGLCSTGTGFQNRLRLCPLYVYAARHWGHHAHADSRGVEELIMNFLQSNTKTAAASQAMLAPETCLSSSQPVLRRVRGVHLLAYFGLRDMLALRGMRQARDVKDTYRRTALWYAADQGHEAMVEFLLELGTYVNIQDDLGWTALMRAARNGHKEVVQLLLKAGADTDAQDNRDGRTAL
ncbi:hypothetical protein AOQ84DRAFT_270304, partial [Glonium stellatum]